MSGSIQKLFPGGSKSKVNKAGSNIRNKCASDEDFQVLDEWRAAHRAVLNTFQAILRNRTRRTKIVVAQRHKRKSTITGKLSRYLGMNLARMDDVAGCRLIFPSVNNLYQFRQKFHKARFKHKRLNEVDKYDYIKNPKSTGYRGIHDVYSYDVKSDAGRTLKGLLVEIQYRTLIQHAWATAVEVIGFITESQPKFQQGDKRYEHAMALASEILARSFEESKGPFPEKGDQELVDEFLRAENELGLLITLRGLKTADVGVTANRNVILIFSESAELEIRTYRGATEALQSLFALEKEMPGNDIVLVRADTTDEVRLAFRNYFSDAYDFIQLIGDGCKKLSGREVVFAKQKRQKSQKDDPGTAEQVAQPDS
ncbi:MAG: RelA/SpoT domain-containing protein [Nitrospirae bacterium]|nr:RelA/SpoT domain-containing protein [Candidatus Manganitrophaceae bacterium]